jgi:hypothetical protein
VNVLNGRLEAENCLALAAASVARVDSRIGESGSWEWAVALRVAHTPSKNPRQVSRTQAYIAYIGDERTLGSSSHYV